MAKIVKYYNNAVVSGTSGADSLTVFGEDTVLDGGAGNDTYYLSGEGSAETATIYEGATGGTDTVVADGFYYNYDGVELAENVENLTLRGYINWAYGNAGNNVIDASRTTGTGPGWYGEDGIQLGGAAGNDTITGSDYRDWLDGGTGNDVLNGGNGEDTLFGEDGNDSLNGGFGEDFLNGGAGNDTLSGGDETASPWKYYAYYAGSDFLYGGAGNDLLNGGNDTLSSEAYSAGLYAGSDILIGGAGNDTINGGNDTLTQSASGYAEVLYGGDDVLVGGDGNDILNGGDDKLTGGNDVSFSGNESFYASTDMFYGGAGNDVINIGDVTVLAGGGNDGLYGGYSYAFGDAGDDTITGGARSFDGGSGDDIIFAVAEDEGDRNTFVGGGGNDVLSGGTVKVTGGTGGDVLYAGSWSFYGDNSGEDFMPIQVVGEADGNDRITGASVTLDGGAGDDWFYGGYTQYYIGGGGNDTIVGGSVTMIGGTGFDRFFVGTGGEDGNAFQVLDGGDGNDTLTAGNLVITDTAGSFRIYGDYGRGVGYAELFGGAGNDILNGANGSDYLGGGTGNDTLNGNNGDDWLDGGEDSDTLNGGAGNDTLAGGYRDGSVDVLAGGAGDDAYYVAWYGGADTITESAGDDTVYFYGSSFTAATGIENIISTGYGSQLLTGNGSDNYIYGAAGDDTLVGGAGNDVLDGGWGDDRMDGGAGNDSYIVNTAGDTVVESTAGAAGGIDSVFVYGYGYGTLGDNVENMTLGRSAGATTLFGNKENNVLTGNAYGNTMYGGAGNDTLITGRGEDVLFGGAGNDLYVVEGWNDDAVYELKGGGTDTVRSNGSFRLGDNIENLILVDGSFGSGFIGYGNALANNIQGSSGEDWINGGAGNDTMVGGAGEDSFVVDSLGDVVTEAANGGDGDSIFVDTRLASGTFLLAANVENGWIWGANNVNLTGNTADNDLGGNSGNNTLDGGAGNDNLWGGAGNDSLVGGAGSDVLDGGKGADTMAGGSENDTYWVDRGDGAGTAITSKEDVVVDTGGIDTVNSMVYTYTLDSTIENLNLWGNGIARKGFGNALDNKMYGNSLGNTLDGAAGNDKLFGYSGNDSLVGGAGNDLLDGGSGDDTMVGGTGNDTYLVDSLGDVVTEVATTVAGGSGIDLVKSWYDFTLGTEVDNLTLYGGADYGVGNGLNNVISGSSNWDTLVGFGGNDTLNGNAGNDFLYGGLGNDTLNGGTGDDTLWGFVSSTVGGGVDSMTGGSGSDRYYIDSTTDVVVEGVNGGNNDSVYIGSLTELTLTLAANVENVYTGANNQYGSGHNVTGNALDNAMFGDFGNNTLSGLAGNDLILGNEYLYQYGDTADTLNGGDGNDWLYDNYGGDTLNGDNGDDYLYGGKGSDTLNGGANNDVLDGGSGADSMTGGAGDDVYWVNLGDGKGAGGPANEDRVVELTGGGTDTVNLIRGPVTVYALEDFVENLSVHGEGTAVTLGGNTLDNVFTVDYLSDGDQIFGYLNTGTDGTPGKDTLNAFISDGSGGGGSVTLGGIEVVNLGVYMANDSDWTLNAGNLSGQAVHISGQLYNGSDLIVSGLAASHTVVLGETFTASDSGTVQLGLSNFAGSSDVLNIGLGGHMSWGADYAANLVSAGVETLNFAARGADNYINVAGVTGETALKFSGTTTHLGVAGLDDGQVIQLQNLAADSLDLSLANSYGGGDFLNLMLDNVVISGSGLNTDNQGGGYGLEDLSLNTAGDPGFANGASFIDGSGIDLGTDVTLYGGQDLTVTNFGGDDFDASGFSGNLSGDWGYGDTTFIAGSGNDTIDLGQGFDDMWFGANLDENDVVDGGYGQYYYDPYGYGGTWLDFQDTLHADIVGNDNMALHIHDVESITFTLTDGLGNPSTDGGAGTVVLDLNDSDTDSVVFTGKAASLSIITGYYSSANINVSGATVTGGASITTGSNWDTIVGGAGNDTLNGSDGYDILTGGAGSDTFVFDTFDPYYSDYVTDFVAGTDKVELSLSIFGDIGNVGSTMTAAAFNSGAGMTSAVEADDRVFFDTNTGYLYYDGDGNGADSAHVIALITGAPTLAATDILVGT
jgi:Ca2+-binding RTX toxin-like protein